MKKAIQALIVFGLTFGALHAKGKKPFELTDWSIFQKETEILEYKGKNALRIHSAPGTGMAILKDLQFEDGIIELDIAAIPTFTGLVFRLRDENVYECIYFRPQNSRHADPARRSHTVQYEAKPRYPWYYLRKNFPKKYEAHVDITPDEWFHVKLIVKGIRAEIFVNHSPSPCLVVDSLLYGRSQGSVGVWTGNGSGGTFADMTVTPSKSKTERKMNSTKIPDDVASIFRTIQSRRSVRKFKTTPVPEEDIMKILDMARSGPTAGNQQPWKFFVTQDRDRLNLLRDRCVESRLQLGRQQTTDETELERVRQKAFEYYSNYLSAPVYVIVLVDRGSKYPDYNIYDGSVAAGYLMIAARALGYGTVFSQDSIPWELIREVYNVPEQFDRICFTPIGVPESWPESPQKKNLEEFVVYEEFIEGNNYQKAIFRTAITVDRTILESYTGTYLVQDGTELLILLDQDQLLVQVQGQSRTPLFAESLNEFFLKVADVQISFVQTKDGRVDQLIIHQGGQNIRADRISS